MLFLKLVTSIIAAVVKKAVLAAGLKVIAHGLTIYSAFETLRSLNECREIAGCVVEVGYDVITDAAVDRLVNEVVDNRFDVTRTQSGLYVASRKPLLQPTIIYPPLEIWQAQYFSEAFVNEWENKSSSFEAELQGRRGSFEDRWRR